MPKRSSREEDPLIRALVRGEKSVEQVARIFRDELNQMGDVYPHGTSGVLLFDPDPGENIFESVNLATKWFYTADRSMGHTLIIPNLSGMTVTLSKTG